MEITVTHQVFVFVASVLCGSVIAFLFDSFRILRRLVRTTVIAALIEDIIYWLIACILFFMFALKVNGGELRSYLFIGTFFGMIIYFALLSKIIIKVFVNVIQFLVKVISKVIEFILYPIMVIISIIKKPIFLVFDLGKKRGRDINRKIRLGFSNFHKYYKKI